MSKEEFAETSSLAVQSSEPETLQKMKRSGILEPLTMVLEQVWEKQTVEEEASTETVSKSEK